MAENQVRIDGAVGSYTTTNPAFTGGYVYSQDEIAGVVAANNFIALTNPVGSGKTILVAGVFITSSTIGGVSSAPPLRGFLATSVSGGTLQAASVIGKIRSTMPNSVGQIRTGNPTATLGAAWFNSPATLAAASESPGFIHQVPATIPAGSITLLPGESTVLRTASGDVNQRWNMTIAWSEI